MDGGVVTQAWGVGGPLLQKHPPAQGARERWCRKTRRGVFNRIVPAVSFGVHCGALLNRDRASRRAPPTTNDVIQLTQYG